MSQQQAPQKSAIERFCSDITEQAARGKLDPVIGRHDEIRRTIQILSRRTKNNPVLVGDPGVGKTALVEGIAQRIIDNDVPESLRDTKILSLDLGLLIAGAKYQGEFEDRLKQLLKEVEESTDSSVIFIDELHMLVGAGSSGGGMDASNLVKPALARGLLRFIGATTVAEYKQYIEKDAALERRFQKVQIDEPSVDDAISIMRGLKDRYELHHGIRISDKALVKAVNLSARMISDRFLPDKAIDVIDEAAAMVKMSVDAKPEVMDRSERRIRQLEIERAALRKEHDDVSRKRLAELEEQLHVEKKQYGALEQQWKDEKKPLEEVQQITQQVEQLKNQFAVAERSGDYARASQIKYGSLNQLEKTLAEKQNKLADRKLTFIKNIVDEDDVAHVLARWMKIPVEKLQASEAERLLNLEDELHKRVVGQREAITAIANTIRIHRAGMSEPNRPFGSFLFLGPTGVGKTEVARTLADYLFSNERAMIRIDMSEYMEKHSVARLIGSPPGYVGYEHGGQLTEQVRRHPYSVILCDEIEKAHSDVHNIFLQMLDEGTLTDGQGRTVSFNNAIIVMTSNVGSLQILEHGSVTPELKKELDAQLLMQFRPEFINRLDQVIYFEPLSEGDVEHIIRIQLQKVVDRMAQQEKRLVVSDAAIRRLRDVGHIPEFGARPLKRAIQQHIIGAVARFILEHPEAHTITVDATNTAFVVS